MPIGVDADEPTTPSTDEPRPAPGETFVLPARGLVFEDLERELVKQALERAGGNQTRAAKLLGMTRDQIRYRIRKFSLGPGTHAAPAAGVPEAPLDAPHEDPSR